MAVNFHLTDEDSDIAGYKRAKLGSKSDNPSLVRSVTNTAAGPSSGIQITRTAAGTALAWITDPLSGVDLTAAAWVLHLWAKESNAAANAALRFQVLPWTNVEGAAALDNNAGTELTTTIADSQITTGNASVQALADGDRLVFKILIDDAGTMATGYTVTFSYNGLYPRAEGDSYVTCPDTLVVTADVPSATQTAVRRLLKDSTAAGAAPAEPQLETAEINLAVDLAIEAYSMDRSRYVTDYLSGDGSAEDFVLPRRWIDGFSSIYEIEYPTGDQERTILETEEYEVVQTVLGGQPVSQLHFRLTTPSSGTDNIAVRYSTRHVHNDELDTISTIDRQAFFWLVASYGAAMLSARAAGSVLGVIQADSVDHRDESERWKDVSRFYRELYSKHIRGESSSMLAASVTSEWDTRTSVNWDYVFHSRLRH